MNLLSEHKHRVLRLTLNRAEKRNALNSAICAELVNQIEAAQENRDTGSILIDALGTVFCAGMDLDEAIQAQEDSLTAVHEKLFEIGSVSLKPIVVCVNGAALGGGVGLVAQGHVVVAAEGAVFGLTEIRIGLWPFLIYRSVEAALGSRRTLELSLTGRLFSPHEALHWGLVHHICPSPEAFDRAAAIARDLAKSSPEVISLAMRSVRDSREKSFSEARRIAASVRNRIMASADFKEGYNAFKEKREPHWPSIPSEFYAKHRRIH